MSKKEPRSPTAAARQEKFPPSPRLGDGFIQDTPDEPLKHKDTCTFWLSLPIGPVSSAAH